MAWIREIDEDDAEGLLKEIYGEVAEKRGKAANILKVHSLRPEALRAHLDLYMATVLGDSKLSREERELIAVVVSSLNRCGYCTLHHREALQSYWHDRESVDDVIRDFHSVGLPPRLQAMLEYAEKLTRGPHLVQEKDVEALRDAGFDDQDVLDIALITSYFNFVNRIALGLGVDVSPEEVAGYQY